MGDLGGFLLVGTFIVIITMVCLWVPYALISLIRPKRPPTAEEILKQRYARGEISEQQYRKMLADLDI